MKLYSAAVRYKATGETLVIKSEYKTKQAFRDDLHRNGYTIIGKVTEVTQ